MWAYKAINEYRPAGDFDAWHGRVREYARQCNDFSSPLPANEVLNTAKSVATWVWRVAPASAIRFSRVQAARGAAKHERFKEEHGIVKYEKEQAKAAQASAAAKRKRTEAKIIEAIGVLTAKGERVSMRAVARLVGISQPTISETYRHLFESGGVIG
jgi:hypothetical protein